METSLFTTHTYIIISVPLITELEQIDESNQVINFEGPQSITFGWEKWTKILQNSKRGERIS